LPDWLCCVTCSWLHILQRFFSLPVFFNSIAWCILLYKYSCTSLQIIIVTKLDAKFYPDAEKFGIVCCFMWCSLMHVRGVLRCPSLKMAPFLIDPLLLTVLCMLTALPLFKAHRIVQW
jgi:hypothetical protein